MSAVSRVLLDTDLAMGADVGADIDDGFALALALADPAIEVELVTTVGGNSDVATSTRLTRALLERLDRADVPVVQGSGPDAPTREAALAMVERVMAEPGELTIVAIGPLTNVALGLSLEPRVSAAVREIVAMGGVYLKQTNDLAMPGEYNFWCDPGAAAAVLAGGAPLRLVGLDVTEQVRLSKSDTSAMAASGRTFAPYAAERANAWIDFPGRSRSDDSQRDSCALHDPLAVAAVSHPSLVTWRPAHVAVETTSALTRGVAIADLLTSQSPPEPNCRIGVAVDAPGFLAHFFAQIGRLP
jgi:purine nucleosidase